MKEVDRKEIRIASFLPCLWCVPPPEADLEPRESPLCTLAEFERWFGLDEDGDDVGEEVAEDD